MTHNALSRINSGAARLALVLVRNLGPMGAVAVALMLASAAVAFILTPRLIERGIALDEGQRATASSGPARATKPDAQSDAAMFSASLPAIAANADDMNKLFEIAAQTNIKTPKADYRLSPLSGSQFLGYEVRIPVNASYLDLRRFTAEALNQLPNLAVDAVRFSRVDSTAESLDGELRLVLFYRRKES